MQSGKIPAEQFIHLNWHIGSWKPAQQMQAEYLIGKSKGAAFWFSMWSHHNVTAAVSSAYGRSAPFDWLGTAEPAPRLVADAKAVEAAYRSGQVFLGQISIPVLDIRHYLEDKFDMHHMSASFAARARIQAAMGHADHHVIWVANEAYTPLQEAFSAMDQWMLQVLANPDTPVWQLKPDTLQDQCFAANGVVQAKGSDVWDGEWNGREAGACSRQYRQYSNSRIQAGGPWQGSIFRCRLIPVEQAMAKQLYGEQDMTAYLAVLEQIFPNGVCDYSAADTARPHNL